MRKGLMVCVGIMSISLVLIGGSSGVAAKENVVYIGYLGPLTGGAAYLGVDSLKGAEFAAEEINALGGITAAGKKYNLKIESYDDEATPAKAVAGLRQLKDRFDIPVVIANVSGSSMAITEINERLGILWCGFAVFPKITQRGNKLVLRYRGSLKYETELFAKGADEIIKAKTYAVLCDTGDYGRAQRENLMNAMEKRGIKHLGTEWFDMRKETDFRVQITKIKTLNPDTISIIAYDEASGQIVKQCRELGVTVPFIMTTGFQTKGREIAGAKNIEGCINVSGLSNMEPLPEALMNYRRNFEKKYGVKAGVYGENNYELVYSIARGMEKAGDVTDAYKIKEGMKAAVPVEKEHWAYGLRGWDDNGDGITLLILGRYKDGKLVDEEGNPLKVPD